ncbi:MAG: glutamine-hydrolyzing GMP synthase [Candidatus Cloacimonetes bacterium]|nr:glutamine-hydrolyzing GMP synthase [Candidatus Cloacimonadota bacterium]
MQNEIAIIDFGGQYTHLIARRIRNLGVFSEIYQPENFEYMPRIQGIIFSGGPQSVTAHDAHRIKLSLLDLPVPLLGICYGHQLIAHLIGGKIESGSNKEYGYTEIKCTDEGGIFTGTAQEQKVWMSHGDHVVELPKGFTVTASTDHVPIAAYKSNNNRIFGVQFHPEVSHTEYGNQILDNFLSICTKQRNWKVENFKEELIAEVRRQAGKNNLLILLSGGVDSLVAMELCLAALGAERIFAIHIDTGFMRHQESANIIDHLQQLGYNNLKLIDAEDRYLSELREVHDPEKKRLIIGRLFVEIANEAISEFNDDSILLVQGTIYPDTIESGDSDKSAKIKTHHNRVSEIEKLIADGKIIEPIKELYKDEVRKLGLELNIPAELVNRHPFPGPGLAIRILTSDSCEDFILSNKERQKLEKISIDCGLNAIILPVRSVGVMGDCRTYEHPVLFSYQNIGKHNWQDLRIAAQTAINQMESVNRALFTVDSKLGNYTLGRHNLSKDACNKLRMVDDLLMERVKSIPEIWQMPVVQLPLFDDEGRQVYVMRPVTSIDAMTADFYEMDIHFLRALVKEVKQLPHVANLFFDITSKPPATIEWE